MDNFNFKVIRDGACGLIGLSKSEVKIINLPIFQRLRRIHQNGFLSNIFPSATHTRFSHSLGVLFYANLMCNKIKDKAKLKPNVIKIIRISALLHDIGHSPFSHTLENVSKNFLLDTTNLTTSEKLDKIKLTNLRKIERLNLIKNIIKIHKDTTKDKKELFGHEIIGSMIIENSPEINEILKTEFGKDYHTCKLKIQKAICGDIDDGIIRGILHSELDADKCDYLNRDSLFSGVKYGFYEFQHILENMDVDLNNREIVFDYKALKSIEYFMLARYFLYNQIYSHKTNLGFNWLAQKSYEALLENDLFINPMELVDSINKKEFDIFEIYDDYNFIMNCRELYQKLKKLKKRNTKQDFNLEVLKKVLYREPLKPVIISETFFDRSDKINNPSNPTFNLVRNFLENDIENLCKSTKIPKEWIINLNFEVPITKLPNKVPSIKIYSPPPKSKEEQQINIVFNKENVSISDVPSSIINKLSVFELAGEFLFTKDDPYKEKIINYLKKNNKELIKSIID